MSDYKIKFTTEADLSGAKKTADGLKEVSSAAHDARKPLEGVAGATENLSTQKKVLKEALKQVGHSIPEVGHLLLFLKNPITIAAGAVAVLVGAFRNYLGTVNEMAKTISVHEAVSRALYILGGAAKDAAGEMADFGKELADAATQGDDAATKFNKVVEAIQKLDLMEAEKRSAAEALDLAGVNAAERDGTITRGDAIRQRSGIKDKFAAQAEQARTARLEEEQAARQDALRKTMEETARAETALPGAVAAAAQAKRAADAAPARLESDMAAITAEKEANATRLQQLQSQRGGFQVGLLEHVGGMAPAGSAASGAAEEMRKRIDQETDRITQRQAVLEKQEAVVKQQAQDTFKEHKAKREAADALKERITGGRDKSGRLFEEMEAGGRALQSFRHHRGVVAPMEREARSIETEGEANKADRDDEQRRNKEFQKSTRRSFGMESSGGAGNVVAAIQDDTAVTLAAFAQIESALREKTRQIELAGARINQMARDQS